MIEFRHKKGGKGSCTPLISTGDHCTISKNCISPWTEQLTCMNGVCMCPPGSREFTSPSSNPLATFCIVPINSPCNDNKDCHSPTAYCEQRLENPVCKCKDGYELRKQRASKNQYTCSSKYYEETCGQFYPQNEKLKDQLKEQRLSCHQGVVTCKITNSSKCKS